MISTITPETSSIGTVARKRRRQIIQSQRIKATNEAAPPSKKACVEPITNSNVTPRNVVSAQVLTSSTGTSNNTTKAKKPQMRYDPDVPMTKEEAAAWRKEQRRKRNRESAAASRQRQRDRITELEQEVSDWKSKYEEALAKIERLEQASNFRRTDGAVSPSPSTPIESTAVSPCSSPRQSPSLADTSSLSCDLVSLQEQSQYDGLGNPLTCRRLYEQEDHVKHLSEKISRPA